MKTAKDTLFSFVMARGETEPVNVRIQLYRALADYAGAPKETAELNKLADDLEAADHRCREFAFKFQKGAGR